MEFTNKLDKFSGFMIVNSQELPFEITVDDNLRYMCRILLRDYGVQCFGRGRSPETAVKFAKQSVLRYYKTGRVG